MLTVDGVLPGIVFVESEFLVPGQFATCGPNALAMAESYGQQAYVSTPTIYARMRAANPQRADLNGASQMWGLEAQANADGFKTVRRNGSAGWRDWAVSQLKAGASVIYEPSYGQALHDEISGAGMNAKDLHYHYDLMVGYWPGGFNKKAGKDLPEGFWMADGDNGTVDSNPGPGAQMVNGRLRMVNGRRLQFYARTTIAASAPYAFMAVYSKVSVAVTTAPAGLGGGFAAKYVQLGMTAAVDIPETYFNDHECFAVFHDGTVMYYNAQTGELTVDQSRGPRAPYLVTVLTLLYKALKDQQQTAQMSDADKADLILGRAFRATLKAAA